MQLDNLNQNQLQAVTTMNPYVRVIAGAGSGKTRVLTTRVAYYVEKLGADPRKIVAITFTNKAAKEMKERVQQELGSMGMQVHISTIHSLCVRILREDIMRMGYPRNFTVMDADDQKSILNEAYQQFQIDKKDISHSSMLDYIANNKAAEISLEHVFKLAKGDFNEEKKAKVYQYYIERQQSMYALDFDDLLLWVRRLFKKDGDCLAKWQYRFQYILVDEFQDVDNVQYDIIKQLAGTNNQVYVVGDPDQTIYTWRGANVDIITHFDSDFPGAITIILDQNYRSTPMILNASNSVIINNHSRVEKQLYSKRPDGDKVLHYSATSDSDESIWIANKISDLHRKGEEYKRFAILYRANYLSRSIEKGLRDHAIPYIIYGGIRFYDRQEIKDMLCYLRMLTGADDLACKRIINVPKRGMGKKAVDTLLEGARAKRQSMYDYIDHATLPSRTMNTLLAFKRQVEDWKVRAQSMSLDKILDMVYQESGYRAMLEMAKEDERIANVKELINDIHDFIQMYPDADLAEYLQLVNLYTDKEETMETDYVQLMTVHAAKGLEFDNVFVCGMSDGIFPSERAMHEGIKGLEEERRLAYVAYTRAKNRLFLTEPQGFSYVMQRSLTESRFIKEIDENYIVHKGFLRNIRDNSSPRYERFDLHKENEDDFLLKPKSAGKPAPGKFKAGDKVVHVTFGNGVVVSVKGQMMDVAFSYPTGVKTLLVGHPSIKKLMK